MLLCTKYYDSDVTTHCTIKCGEYYTASPRHPNYGWESGDVLISNGYMGTIDKIPYWNINGSRITFAGFYWSDLDIETGATACLMSSEAKQIKFNEILVLSDRWLTTIESEGFYLTGFDIHGMDSRPLFLWDESSTTVNEYRLILNDNSSKDIEGLLVADQLLRFTFDPAPTGYL